MIRIASLSTALELSVGCDKVVSLIDPGTTLPNFQEDGVPLPGLILYMHDTEIITDMWSPKMEDIHEVFTFCRPGENVLVHCNGGISRSTAMAIGLLVRSHLTITDAVKAVHSQSPNMSPNKLILQHIDYLFEMDGELVREVGDLVVSLDNTLYLYCSTCMQHFPDDTEQHRCPGWQQ